MTRDILLGDELPDWAGAKEFYQKYDPKEVIGRLVWVLSLDLTTWNYQQFTLTLFGPLLYRNMSWNVSWP